MAARRYREFESILLQPGVRLCALESRKYKTARAHIFLLDPLRRETATENALLAYVLRAGSRKHPTRRDLARAGEELYGASTSVGVTRFGDVQAIAGRAEFPADRFLPKGANELQRVLALLAEMLFDPATGSSQSLREETLTQEKYQLEQDLKGIADEKPQFAMLEAQKRIYAGSPGALYEFGCVEDIAGVTAKSLFARHQALLRNTQVMAFVVGPVEPKVALAAMAKSLKLPKAKRPDFKTPAKLKHQALKRDKLTQQVEQAHLVFAWSGAPLYGERAFAAAGIADAIFGGLPVSRLFRIVREEHGLAYAVSTHLAGVRGASIGYAAVHPDKIDAAAKLVHGEFARLQKKGFTDEEFEAARASLIEAKRAQLDSLGARVTETVFQSVLKCVHEPEKDIAAIEKAKPAEVLAVFRRLKPHTEFRLAP